ncbi:hypothetical protein [Zoogloea sp.]|uniref:hypothetical protein n=1 Tax=Zoogloea sp. TaxID=49181 RepID=UPI0037D9D3CA
MELEKNVRTERREIIIGEKLIEVGDDAWQIRNLTGVSRREAKVVLDAPEPTFNEKEPSGSINILAPIFWAGLGFGGAAFFNSEVPFWIGIVIAVFSIWDGKSSEKQAWANRKASFEKLHAVWKKLKDDPPIVYSLAIETNAGSRPVFYSFDREGIAKVVKAVKDAMINPEHSSTTYNINAIDLSGDTTVNNVGSTIYEQNIKEIRA